MIDEVNAILGNGSAGEWSYTFEQWEEEVATGGAGEQHDSVSQTVSRRAVTVTRNGETWTIDTP